MFCRFCGAKLLDGANFCTKCGKAVKRKENPVQPTKKIMEQPQVETNPAEKHPANNEPNDIHLDVSLDEAKKKAGKFFNTAVNATKTAAISGTKSVVHDVIHPAPNIKKENYGGRFPTDHSRYKAFLIFMWAWTIVGTVCLLVQKYAVGKMTGLQVQVMGAAGSMNLAQAFRLNQQMNIINSQLHHYQTMAGAASIFYGFFFFLTICVILYISLKSGVLSYLFKVLLGIFVSVFIGAYLGLKLSPIFFPITIAIALWANRKRWQFIRKYFRYVQIQVTVIVLSVFAELAGFIGLIAYGLLRMPSLLTISFIGLLIGIFGPTLAIHSFFKQEERRGMPFMEAYRLLTVVPVTAIFFIVGIVGLISIPGLSGHYLFDNFDWSQLGHGIPDVSAASTTDFNVGTGAVDMGQHLADAATVPGDTSAALNPAPLSGSPNVSDGMLNSMDTGSTSDVAMGSIQGNMFVFPDISSFMQTSLPQFHDAGFIMDPDSMLQCLPDNGQGIMFQTMDGSSSMTLKDGKILGPDGNLPIGQYHYDAVSKATVIEDPTGMTLGKVIGNQLYDASGALQVEMSPKNDVVSVGYVDGKPAFQIIGKPGSQMVMSADNSEVYGELKLV